MFLILVVHFPLLEINLQAKCHIFIYLDGAFSITFIISEINLQDAYTAIITYHLFTQMMQFRYLY